MHASGVGELADVGPGHFNGRKYIEILEEVLLPSVETLLFLDNSPFYLVQDNSPIHNCRVVKEWFAHHPHITLLPHPSKSPDLNPIEQVSAAMVRGMPSQERHQSHINVVNSAF